MSEALGELQLQVMDIVWQSGRATVAEVHQVLSQRRKIAYTTVLTTMRALERRGMVRHDQVGKAYVYEPVVSREKYTDSSVGTLVNQLFEGRREALLCHLLGTNKVSRKDVAQIRKMLAGEQKGGDES